MPQVCLPKRLDTLFNMLEPQGFIDAFVSEPPEGFQSREFQTPEGNFYGFIANLDLFTTMSENLKNFRQQYDRWVPQFIKNILKPRVLFIGTPASEYALFPPSLNFEQLKQICITELKKEKAAFLVMKDIPKDSPLLSEAENDFSDQLLHFLEQQGFLILAGQALAYIPINFSSREEYLQRFSNHRKKNIQRKLKMFSKVTVQELKTGDPSIDESLQETMYSLYLNVYNNSYIHFEKQRFPFFKQILTNPTNQGLIFLFYVEEKLIGYSLCFHYQNMLVEKYIGSLYPDSREYNFYYLNWFHKLEYCLRHQLEKRILGCTNPEIKAYLGADFTQTYHAVYLPNPLLRCLGQGIKSLFESDQKTMKKIQS